jgi:hypothetical protein
MDARFGLKGAKSLVTHLRAPYVVVQESDLIPSVPEALEVGTWPNKG